MQQLHEPLQSVSCRRYTLWYEPVFVMLVVMFMCRRDLFMAVRLALAKLGAGSGAGAEDGDRNMPIYGTGVTINTRGQSTQ